MLKKNDLKNIDLLIARKEIKVQFEKILTDLRKTVERNGYAVQTIERFRGCLENPENSNVSRLPLYSPTSFSPKHNKINCVLCVIGFTVSIYWDFCNGHKELETKITKNLSKLERIAEKGLGVFRIAGEKYPDGYYLVEK